MTTLLKEAALYGLRNVPTWAQQREAGGVPPAMVQACSPDNGWVTLPQIRRALASLARENRIVRVSPGHYALPGWPAAKEAR